jgi:MFS family permease
MPSLCFDSDRNFRGAIVILALCSSLALANVEVVLPAIIQIQTSMMISSQAMRLAFSFYVAVLGLSLIFWGVMADYWGAKKILLVGLSLNFIGCTICFKSDAYGFFILGRLVQAIGCAACMVMPRLIIIYLNDEKLKLKCLSFFASVTAMTPILSILIGVRFNISHQWRIIFLLMALVTLVLICSVYFMININYKKHINNNFLICEYFNDKHYLSSLIIISFVFSAYFLMMSNLPLLLGNQFNLRMPKVNSLLLLLTVSFYFGIQSLSHGKVFSSLYRLLSCALMLSGLFLVLVVCFYYIGQVKLMVMAIMGFVFLAGCIVPLCQYKAMINIKNGKGQALGMFFTIEMLSAASVNLCAINLLPLEFGALIGVMITCLLISIVTDRYFKRKIQSSAITK